MRHYSRLDETDKRRYVIKNFPPFARRPTMSDLTIKLGTYPPFGTKIFET